MRVRGRVFGLLVLMLLGAVALSAQPQPLNPTVTLLPEPTAPVPPECDDAATPPPRLEVERIPPPQLETPPPMPPAPPSTDLRSQLRALHAAVAARDRATFEATLAQTKQMLATYPPGGERSAATEAIAVFDEIASLWNHQFRSPTGSFFDETSEGGALLRTLKKYPGYEEAVRREVITDASGARFYPTDESMDFLLNVAGQRVGRVGVSVEHRAIMPRTPAPATEPAREPQVVERAPSGAPAAPPAKPTRRTTTRRETPARTTAPPSTPARPRATSAATAPSTPAQSTPAPSTQPSPAPPIDLEPDSDLPLPAGVVSDPAAESDPATTTDIDPAATTDPVLAPPDQTPTTTAVEQAPVESPDAAATARPGRRSIILPLVLILIGVGVLILLFRASS